MRNLRSGIMNRKEIEDKISHGEYTYGDVGIPGCHYIETLFIPVTEIIKTVSNDSQYRSKNGKRVKDTVPQQVEYYKDQMTNDQMSSKDKLPTVEKLDSPVIVDGHTRLYELIDGYHKTIAVESNGMEGYAYDVYSFDNEVRRSVFQQQMNCPSQTQQSTQDDVVKNMISLIDQGLVKKSAAEVTKLVEEMWPHKVIQAKQRCISAILYETKIPIAFESLTGEIAEKWYEKRGLSPAGGKIDPKTKMRVVTVHEGYETRRIIDAIAAFKEQDGTQTLFRCYVKAPGKTQTVRDKRKKMLATIKRYSEAQANVGTTIFPYEVEGFIPQQKDGVDRDDFTRLIPVSEIK